MSIHSPTPRTACRGTDGQAAFTRQRAAASRMGEAPVVLFLLTEAYREHGGP